MQPHEEPVQISAAEAAFASQLPRLTWVSAPVLVTDRETSIRLLVRGQYLHHIADERGSGPHGQSTPTTLIARCGHDDSLTRSTSWLGGDTAEILICAPELSADGCALVWLEAWSGAYLSPAIPIFVTSNTDLACRVENLSYSLMDGLRERVRPPCMCTLTAMHAYAYTTFVPGHQRSQWGLQCVPRFMYVDRWT